ncbi:hypothetical protein [Roseibium sediminicola]|uniref:Uncharacterized protein n=1 Tax=Roseibium sediminicola TaxID=2933272 RepID=A0ABT0H162_9HYPH|nr:hypothetical protein [Roseibium sp. CAU 1639]MCK7615210.1 hypothetical protein [Roseibium sp. CAU 1639]
MSLQIATSDIRQTLKVFSWARAQHLLRCRGYPVSFAGAAALVAAETGIRGTRAAAALSGGFSSADTQARLAAWNGLSIKQKHGEPVLVADPDADFERGSGGGAVPVSIEEAQRRLERGIA